tara:strand:- start:10 stop:264 length:255 start_codon:yes stop_codon:yes gene_type:complete
MWRPKFGPPAPYEIRPRPRPYAPTQKKERPSPSISHNYYYTTRNQPFFFSFFLLFSPSSTLLGSVRVELVAMNLNKKGKTTPTF